MPAFESPRSLSGQIVATLVIFSAALRGAPGDLGVTPASEATAIAGRAAGTGSAAILLAGGRAEGFSSVRITVSRLELIGAGGSAVLFAGRQPADLQALERESLLLSLSSDVPAGAYGRIRVQLDGVELKRPGGEPVAVEIAGNGRMEIDALGPMVVQPDETLVIRLDLHAEKSMLRSLAGGVETCRFRPVMTASVIEHPLDQRLVRLQGRIREIDPAGRAFRLCLDGAPFASAAAGGRASGPAASGKGIDVLVEADTALFNARAEGLRFHALRSGDRAAAIGRLRCLPAGEEESDDAGDRRGPLYSSRGLFLEAAAVEMGGLLRIDGEIRSPLDGEESFLLAPFEGQGFEPGAVLTVRLARQARVFSKLGEEEEKSSLRAGRPATVDGILETEGGSGSILASPFAIVDTQFAGAVESRRGRIAGIDRKARSFRLERSGEPAIRIRLAEAADIFRIAIPDGLDAAILAFDGLEEGQEAELFGRDNSFSGSFEAETILALSGAPAARP